MRSRSRFFPITLLHPHTKLLNFRFGEILELLRRLRVPVVTKRIAGREQHSFPQPSLGVRYSSAQPCSAFSAAFSAFASAFSTRFSCFSRLKSTSGHSSFIS